jgi:uncharacterized coiled-coil protein SlyX
MPKGHSTLEPRIADLEQQVAALKLINKAHTSWTEDIALGQPDLLTRIADLERRPKGHSQLQEDVEAMQAQLDALIQAVRALERRLEAANERFAKGYVAVI